MRANTLICRALLSGALAAAVSGCTTYAPSALPHTYVTNTQQSYAVAGFRVISDPPNNAGVDTAQQSLLLTKSDIRVFVNGQVALVVNAARSNQTVVQLPQGQHVVAVQLVSQGIMTLGFQWPESVREYSVSIPAGQLVEARVVWENDGSYKYTDNIGQKTSVDYVVPGLEFSGALAVNQLR